MFILSKLWSATNRGEKIRIDVICDNCKVEFSKHQCRIRNLNFCCRTCADEFKKAKGKTYNKSAGGRTYQRKLDELAKKRKQGNFE